MKKPLLYLSAVAALNVGIALPLKAVMPLPTSWLGGTGLWQTPANWSNNIPTQFGDAFIDNGLTTVNSVVTLVGAGAAHTLTIDLGDQLIIGSATAGSNSTLTVENLPNAGLISPGQAQTDTLTYTSLFTNTGTLAANNNSTLILNCVNFVNTTFVNNGLIDVSENPGDTFAHAEFNATNAPGGMNITGSGNISIHDGGSLSFDNPVNINSTGFINDNSTPGLFIDAASTITIAGLTGTGAISASGGLSQITLNSPAASVSTFSGSIAGNVSVVKNGSGTAILSGNNAYLGTTDLFAGTLQVDGTVGFGNMTVHNGGTFAGTGSTHGFVTIASGGIVSPGDNGGASPGTLTAAITLLLQSGSTLKLDLGNTPGASDLINVSNGEFDAANVNVQLVPHDSLTWHQTYTLINWSGALSLNGITPSAFQLLPSGVNGNFVVDNTADTVSFFVLGDAGDANEDGKVDLNDLNIVLNHLGTASTAWTNGNFDGQPTIDLTDLNDVLNNLGTTSIAPAAALAPEPTTLALLAATLPLLISRRRRSPEFTL